MVIFPESSHNILPLSPHLMKTHNTQYTFNRYDICISQSTSVSAIWEISRDGWGQEAYKALSVDSGALIHIVV